MQIERPRTTQPGVNWTQVILVFLAGLVPAWIAALMLGAAINLHYEFHPVFFVPAAIAAVVAWLVWTAALRAARIVAPAAWAVGLIVLALCGGFAWLWASFPDPSDALRRDRPLLDEVPRYPGASPPIDVTHRRYGGSDMYAEGFISPPQGYDVSRTWRLPRTAKQLPTIRWYAQRLEADGWHVVRNSFGAGKLYIRATRGSDRLAIDFMARRDPPEINAGRGYWVPTRVESASLPSG